MSLSFSVLSLNRISVWAFHRMVPLALVVPSTLLAMMRHEVRGFGSIGGANVLRVVSGLVVCYNSIPG